MNAKELADIFMDKKYHMRMGSGLLSRRYGVDKEVVMEAKDIARKNVELPHILLIDIETAPLKAYVWTRWNQNVYPDQLISDWFTLTWSAKWLFNSRKIHESLTPDEVLREDDSRIIKSLWALLDQADIVIAHNGDKFDLPRINSRFIVNGLPPVSPYQSIDTKKIAAKQFGFSSNKLSELAKVFGMEGKMDTDFELWAKCMNGDKVAMKYMQDYNDQDVAVLEEVYLKLRPWIKSHPNCGLYMELDVPVCSNCGSTKLTPLDKYYYTQTGKYETLRCECGAIGRRRTTTLDKESKRSLIVGLAT